VIIVFNSWQSAQQYMVCFGIGARPNASASSVGSPHIKVVPFPGKRFELQLNYFEQLKRWWWTPKRGLQPPMVRFAPCHVQRRPHRTFAGGAIPPGNGLGCNIRGLAARSSTALRGSKTLLRGHQMPSPRPWKMIRYFHPTDRNPSRLIPPATYGVSSGPP
jgi:hypothetical protein